MADRFLTTSAVTATSENSQSTALRVEVRDALGDPDRLAWFVDEDSGLVYVVPESEVTIR